MVAVEARCEAITKTGERCKRRAQAGSPYCHVHQRTAVATAAAETTAATQREPGAPASPADAQLAMLLAELDALARELQKRAPDFVPPQFTPSALLDLIEKNMARIVPEEQAALFHDLRRNLRDVTAQDLVDPETWKGLWYVLNYSLRAQSAWLLSRLSERVASLPGMDVLAQLKGNLEGTSPRDLLDPDTWKGFWYIASYTAQLQLQQTKDRLMGKGSADR